MSKHFHHKSRHFDFAETRAAKSRDTSRRFARGMKESWLFDALTSRD